MYWQKFFTLREYNEKLINFSYGYSESDKPIPILSRVLHGDASLRSSASQMQYVYCPSLLDLYFQRMMSIGNVSCFWGKLLILFCAPLFVNLWAQASKHLLKTIIVCFLSLYEKYIPKLHLIVHYSEQMLSLGPMTKSWTIRHEAKLNFFKQASKLDNFTLSMANHHQRWACYEFSKGDLLSSQLNVVQENVQIRSVESHVIFRRVCGNWQIYHLIHLFFILVGYVEMVFCTRTVRS